MKRLLFFSLGLLLTGCTGKIITTTITPSELSTAGKTFTGVPVFLPALFYETSEFRELLDDKGKTVGKEPTDCTVVQKKKVVAKPDYANPLLVAYEPGYLEGYTFGIDYNPDGSIKGVNNKSEPDQGKTLLNLTSAAANVAKLAAGAPEPGNNKPKPFCDGGESTIGLSRFPLTDLK